MVKKRTDSQERAKRERERKEERDRGEKSSAFCGYREHYLFN
jgi:hypothetical protein